MFDNVCKFLAATFPSDFATWLLGESVPSSDPLITLNAVATQIEAIPEPSVQSNVAASTAILAGLVFGDRGCAADFKERTDARITCLSRYSARR